MADIVLIASYPKSGNTWLRAVMNSAWRGGVPVDINNLMITSCADRQVCNRFLGVNTSDLTLAEIVDLRPRIYAFAASRSTRTLFLKIHDAWLPGLPGGNYPLDPGCIKAIIYVVRDPRDVAVSFARHLGKSIDATIDLMRNALFRLSGSSNGLRRQIPQLLSSWSMHAASWIHAFPRRIYVTRYEDMLVDPQRVFAQALAFAGIEASQAAVQGAVAATRFDQLSSQETEHGFVERPERSAKFFRRGVAGGWRDTLTAQQARRVVQDHGTMMEFLKYPVS